MIKKQSRIKKEQVQLQKRRQKLEKEMIWKRKQLQKLEFDNLKAEKRKLAHCLLELTSLVVRVERLTV